MDRLGDINVQKLVWTMDGLDIVGIEAYGEQLDGTPTWIQLHMAPNCEYKRVRLGLDQEGGEG